MARQVVAQLRPRYPLFGSWSVDFVFGYSLPLTPFVAKLPGGALRLTASLGPAVRDLITEDLTVKVGGHCSTQTCISCCEFVGLTVTTMR